MVTDGDCILHTNYRQDRAIQLSMAFVEQDYPGNLKTKRNIKKQFVFFFVGLETFSQEVIYKEHCQSYGAPVLLDLEQAGGPR